MKNIIYLCLALISISGYAQNKSSYLLEKKDTLTLPDGYALLRISGYVDNNSSHGDLTFSLSTKEISYDFVGKLYDNINFKEFVVKTGRYNLNASVEDDNLVPIKGKDLVINRGQIYDLTLKFHGKKAIDELLNPPPLAQGFRIYEKAKYFKGFLGKVEESKPKYDKAVSKDMCRIGFTFTDKNKNRQVDTMKVFINTYDKDSTCKTLMTDLDTLYFNVPVNSSFGFVANMYKEMNNPNNYNYMGERHVITGNAFYQGQTVIITLDRSRNESLRREEYEDENKVLVEKPVIYFYSDKELDLTINLNTDAKLKFTYPIYTSEWKGTVKRDGTFETNGNSYPYIFWDGEMDVASKLDNLEEGFIVEKEQNVAFFEGKLSKMGLNDKEIADFITFWVPRMLESDKHFVQFIVGENYNKKIGSLEYSTQPDSEIRIFMVFSKLEGDIQVKPQLLPTYKREGFTVVEWGGSELNLFNSQLSN